MLDQGTLLAVLGFSSLQFAGGIWTGIRLRPSPTGSGGVGRGSVDLRAAELLAAVEAQSASLFALRHQAAAITTSGETHHPRLNVDLLGELRLLQQTIGEVANSLHSSVAAYEGTPTTKQARRDADDGSSFRFDQKPANATNKAALSQSSRSMEGGPLTVDPQRRAYKVGQRVAEYNGFTFPHHEDFTDVQCQELWMDGISFVTADPPSGEKVVVTLGSPENPMYMAARISECVSAVIRGQLSDRYVVSCTFLGRLAPPRSDQPFDQHANKEFAHASLSRR